MAYCQTLFDLILHSAELHNALCNVSKARELNESIKILAATLSIMIYRSTWYYAHKYFVVTKSFLSSHYVYTSMLILKYLCTSSSKLIHVPIGLNWGKVRDYKCGYLKCAVSLIKVNRYCIIKR